MGYRVGVDWSKLCAAVIPCLNEAAAIGPLVAEVRGHVRTVLVVDDGSSDATGRLAKEHGAEVIRHDSSRGKGASLREAIRLLHARAFNWALVMDGDGQHLPADIPRFFEKAETTDAAMVVGNRMAAAHSMPWVRRKTNQWMSHFLSRLVGQILPDTQCGFRLIRIPVWRSLDLRTERFEIESESLVTLLRHGHRVEFVPVRCVYENETSKISPLRDAIRWLRWYRHAKQAPVVAPLTTKLSIPR